MTWLWQRIKDEPVMFGTAIRLGFVAAMAFGLQWTAEQLAAAMAFVETVIAFLTRGSVTPNTKVDTVVTVERSTK
jgi:3-hydroxymyristoyl/3-hydroxydecanoyl-(acyl carrier protein) dehydratase